MVWNKPYKNKSFKSLWGQILVFWRKHFAGYTHKSLKSGLEVRNGGGGQKSIFLDLLRET